MMSGSPAAARNVGNQSWCWTISLETVPASIFPGQRMISGTRNAPSQLVAFSLRNGVVPPSGQVLRCGPLSLLIPMSSPQTTIFRFASDMLLPFAVVRSLSPRRPWNSRSASELDLRIDTAMRSDREHQDSLVHS